VHLRRPSRILFLLLACLALSLLFPRACTGARIGAGGLLPGTAPLTGSTYTPEADVALEATAVLRHENARLREDIDALATAPGDIPVVRPTRAGRPVGVLARVLHRDASSTRRSFLIDVGSDDGVRPGLAVAHGQSLVGVVGAVSARTARVLRVDDLAPLCRFPAIVRSPDPKVLREGRGACQGTADGRLLVSFLAKGDARVGDTVVTGAGRYPIPEGLSLGVVGSVSDDDRDAVWEAVVRPLRDLDELTSVLVIVREELAVQVRPK